MANPTELLEKYDVVDKAWREFLKVLVAAQGSGNGADRLLTAAEAAGRLGLTRKALYNRRFPFAKRIGKRTLRYSEKELEAWLTKEE